MTTTSKQSTKEISNDEVDPTLNSLLTLPPLNIYSILQLIILFAPIAYYFYPYLGILEFQILLGFSLFAYWLTVTVIPHTGVATKKAGLWGKDLNKGEAGAKMQMYVFII